MSEVVLQPIGKSINFSLIVMVFGDDNVLLLLLSSFV